VERCHLVRRSVEAPTLAGYCNDVGVTEGRDGAQLLGRVPLSADSRKEGVEVLLGCLEDDGSIVKTFAMPALADLALKDEHLYPALVPVIEGLTATGTPAMRARGRQLLRRLVTTP